MKILLNAMNNNYPQNVKNNVSASKKIQCTSVNEKTLKSLSKCQFALGVSSISFKSKELNLDKQILEKYLKNGLSRYDICHKLELSRKSYSGFIKKFNLIELAKETENKIKQITSSYLNTKLNDEKETMETIALDLGISPYTMQSAIIDNCVNVTQATSYFNKLRIVNKFYSLLNTQTSKENICKELHIDDTEYKTLLAKAQTYYEPRTSSEIVQQIIDLKLQGKNDGEIANQLAISSTSYRVLYKKHDIKGMIKEIQNCKIEEISPRITSLLKAGMSPKEICSELKISEFIYNKALKLHDIETIVKQDLKENATRDLVGKIIDLVKQGKSSQEICSELNMNLSNYKAFIKKEGLGDEINKIRDENKKAFVMILEQFKELRKQGKACDEICNQLGISNSMYDSLVEKNITANDILKLIKKGKTQQEILSELGVTQELYKTLLKKFGMENATEKSTISEFLTKELFESRFAKGQSPNQIALEFGVNPHLCYDRMKELKILSKNQKSSQRISKTTIDEINYLKSTGMTNDNIAKELGISKESLTLILRKARNDKI